MSDLHIEKTRTSTLEQSRRLEEVTLQSGAVDTVFGHVSMVGKV